MKHLLVLLAFVALPAHAIDFNFVKGKDANSAGQLLLRFSNDDPSSSIQIAVEVEDSDYLPLADDLWRTNIDMSAPDLDILTLEPNRRRFVVLQFKYPGEYFACFSEVKSEGGFVARNCLGVRYEK